MSLNVAYSYCLNLTEEEKFQIDKQVRKNRFQLKWAIFFPIPWSPFIPQLPFFPVEGFSPQQMVRNAKDRFESAVSEAVLPFAQFADDCHEMYNEYKVYKNMSKTLTKTSELIRKDAELSKSLDKLEQSLKDGEFHAGRGAKRLAGTKTVFYMRAGNQARVYYIYSTTEEGALEIIAESNKAKQPEVISNIKKKHK